MADNNNNNQATDPGKLPNIIPTVATTVFLQNDTLKNSAPQA
jgi:hypothetical protein